MRRVFLHAASCEVKVAGGCLGCRKFWFLIKQHVRQCRDAKCGLMNCAMLKQQRRRQQEGENDRRVMSMSSAATTQTEEDTSVTAPQEE